ncbi:hypothetical protein M407DRAFT_25894 [Tulasnella calospora MUT 4182]|uniref:Uncharacterized protein n=1 Tax=Tulasnella calospora MUT 4182 TaxID=1051891 RepID=A0A0C3QFA3_9AGAM|nr:hypothetical protein M407DRAFT_25894 [Tulasnella calospora MUT 4182]
MLGIGHLSQFQFCRRDDSFNLGGASGNTTANVVLPSSVSEAEEDQIILSLLGSADNEDLLNARAAHWILRTTTNLDDQLVVAQNMCNLTAKTCYIIAEDSDGWAHLLFAALRAIHRWNGQPEDANNRATAEQFGVALYHSLAGYSPQSKPWRTTQFFLPLGMFHGHKGSLSALAFLIGPFKYRDPLAFVASKSNFANLDFRFRKAMIHKELLSANEYFSWDVMAKSLSNGYDDGILSMLAFYIVHRYRGQEQVANAPIMVPDARDRANWRVQLLEAYDGENLGRNILGALDAGVLVFDKSLDSWDGPVKVYTTFVRTVQNLTTSNETTKSSLANSLIKLVTKVEWKTPGSVEQTMLVVEILRRIKLLQGRSWSIGDEGSLALWHGLGHIVQVATIEARAAVIDFDEAISDALDLDSNSPRSNSLHAARITEHPRVVAWFVSKVGGFPSAARRWLKLMRKFETEWFGSKPSLQQLWIDYRLGGRVLASFRTIENGDDLFLMSPILIQLILFESPKSRQQLVEAGLVPAMVDMVIRICRDRERFDATRWRDGAYLVLEIFFQVWEFSERDHSGGVTSDRMVLAFKNMLPILESNLRREQDDGTGFHEQLLHFTEYIQQRRGISTLISHNFDVALNRLYAECDKKVEWGYQSYGQPRSLCCTLRDFVNDEMF